MRVIALEVRAGSVCDWAQATAATIDRAVKRKRVMADRILSKARMLCTRCCCCLLWGERARDYCCFFLLLSLKKKDEEREGALSSPGR